MFHMTMFPRWHGSCHKVSIEPNACPGFQKRFIGCTLNLEPKSVPLLFTCPTTTTTTTTTPTTTTTTPIR